MVKKAFYPCCASDIGESYSILSEYVDEIYYCDISNYAILEIGRYKGEIPRAILLHGDAREKIDELKNIDVLFYRRDSDGEGGSGLFVLGDSFFPNILERFNPSGGCIITDGSNSRGNTFRKMMRNSGYTKYGWHIYKSEDQNLYEKYSLYIFHVDPVL